MLKRRRDRAWNNRAGMKKKKTAGRRICRYRLSAFGEFYKISQEVLETEGTMASTVAVKETPLRDLTTELKGALHNKLKHINAHYSVVGTQNTPSSRRSGRAWLPAVLITPEPGAWWPWCLLRNMHLLCYHTWTLVHFHQERFYGFARTVGHICCWFPGTGGHLRWKLAW